MQFSFFLLSFPGGDIWMLRKWRGKRVLPLGRGQTFFVAIPYISPLLRTAMATLGHRRELAKAVNLLNWQS